jgi:hypothetical protein
MSRLTDRKFSLQIDTISISGVNQPGLRVSAKVTRSLKTSANVATFTVYNLNPSHRRALTKVKNPAVALTAGYKDQVTRIFVGQTLHVVHDKKPSGDILTTLSTTDSGADGQTARKHVSFPKGVSPGDVLKTLVTALGVKPGNLNRAIALVNAGKAASIYAEGKSVSGHVPTEVTNLCRSCGLEWSIQDGAIQFLEVGKALDSEAIVLDSSLLIGSPTISSKGVAEFTTFLQKDFSPGRQVQIAHPFVTGIFRLEKVDYTLDSYTDDWIVHAETKAPGSK